MDHYECRKCHLIKPVSGFYVRNGEPDTTWCVQCYRDWYVERSGGLVEKTCEHCGAAFECTVRQSKRQRFCSRECKVGARREKDKAERLAAKQSRRVCLHCATPFGPEKRSNAMFCTERCREASSNFIKKINRRSETFGVPGIEGEYFNRAYILTRDNFTCHICGGSVDMALEYPDPMMASIDHVIPFVFGGDNDMANLRLSHLQCNMEKGRTERRCYAP